jgi:hypothetical protein
MKTHQAKCGVHQIGLGDGVTHVIASGDAKVHCLKRDDALTVVLTGRAICYSSENCHVIAQNHSRVFARGGLVEAFDDSSIEASADTNIVARGWSQVALLKPCPVSRERGAPLKDAGTLELRDASRVDYEQAGFEHKFQIASVFVTSLANELLLLVKHMTKMPREQQEALLILANEITQSRELTSLIAKFSDEKWQPVLATPEVMKIFTVNGFRF